MTQRKAASELEWTRSVFERHERSLIRYAAKITGNAERARDVVQDTFLRLCAEPRDKIEGHVSEWLFTVCRNRAVDVQRKESRMNPLTEAHLATRDSRDAGPAAALEASETMSQILKVLDSIPQNQQEVIRLKFQNGFSYREIAKITGLTISNVGFLIHTGIKAIRQRISAEGGAARRS
jgi:RNA polymerase sigma-70 factor (ECF subfamily)